MNLDEKRLKEIETIQFMIQLYCRRQHKEHSKKICYQCESLSVYAVQRIEQCPFMETKTFCSQCQVHCYKKDMRKLMKKVMRFSGPRMLLYHPKMALSHLYLSRKEKKK